MSRDYVVLMTEQIEADTERAIFVATDYFFCKEISIRPMSLVSMESVDEFLLDI